MPVATAQLSEDHSNVCPGTFHVAIIGGGIGGLTAALSLATYSPQLTNITVFEQASEYGEIGAGVGIGIQAGRVLQKLGVWERANAISGSRNGVHRSTRRWDNDGLIVDVPAVNSQGRESEVGQLWVHRAEILEVLYTEIRRKKCAKLETNKRAIKLEVRKFLDLGVFVLMSTIYRIMVQPFLSTLQTAPLLRPILSLLAMVSTAQSDLNLLLTSRPIQVVSHTGVFYLCQAQPWPPIGRTPL